MPSLDSHLTYVSSFTCAKIMNSFWCFCIVFEEYCNDDEEKIYIEHFILTHSTSCEPSSTHVGIFFWLLFTPVVMTFICRFFAISKEKYVWGYACNVFPIITICKNMMMSHIKTNSRAGEISFIRFIQKMHKENWTTTFIMCSVKFVVSLVLYIS